MAVIKVGAIDNHPVVLEGVRAALARTAPDIEVVAIAGTTDQLLAGPGAAADVVLLDLGIPDSDPAQEAVRRLIEAGMIVLIFTSEGRPIPVRRAVEAGAAGLLLKIDPVETIAEAIRDAVDGRLACSGPLAAMLLTDATLGTKLSPRQIEILEAVSEGLPYRLVAKRLGVAEVTVREHLNRAAAAYRERGVEPGNVHGLVSRARQDGNLAD